MPFTRQSLHHQDDRAAIDAMLPYWRSGSATPHPYAWSRRQKRPGDRQEDMPRCWARSPEIYFTSGGTEATTRPALRRAHGKGGKTHIVSTALSTTPCSARWSAAHGGLCRHAAAVVRPACEPERCLRILRTRAGVCYGANNEIGLSSPLTSGRHLPRGRCLHTDAVQAVGHVEQDMRAWRGHALRLRPQVPRPKGAGFLYVRKGRSRRACPGGAGRADGPGPKTWPAGWPWPRRQRECAEHREADSLR
jgi:cysteine sulfinate desulfinase/cysteine desulfurase-like protein